MAEPEVSEMRGVLVLRPGDKVLIPFSQHLTAQDAHEIQEKLGERFPGVEFTLVDGVAGGCAHAPG